MVTAAVQVVLTVVAMVDIAAGICVAEVTDTIHTEVVATAIGNCRGMLQLCAPSNSMRNRPRWSFDTCLDAASNMLDR